MIYSSSTFLEMMQGSIDGIKLRISIFDHNWKYIDEVTEDVLSDIGTISCSNSSAIRRSMTLNLNNFKGKYIFGESNLVWLNKRFKVELGISAYGKPFEYIPQGVFVLAMPVNANGISGATASIELHDLAFLYSDRRGLIKNHLEIAAGAKITDTIKTVADVAYPTNYLFDDISDTVPYTMSWEPNTSRWQIISELAEKAKCSVFFDVNGYLRLKKVDLSQIQNAPSVWMFDKDAPSERFYAGSLRKFDERNLANCVRVLGGKIDGTVYLYDIEIDETIPKWAGHPYSIQRLGRIQYFHKNGDIDYIIDSQSLAEHRGRYELMKRCGYDEQVSVTLIPHYLLEVDDVITIKDNNNGVDGRYLIESMTIPLSPQHMTLECRKQNMFITDWNSV